MTRSSLWDMSLPGFDKCIQAKGKKSVGRSNILSVIRRAAFGPFLLSPRCVSHVARRTRIYVHTRTHMYTHRCAAPTMCRTALTLLLLAAPAYGYGSIIARYTETYLEAFAAATSSLSPRALPLYHFWRDGESGTRSRD